MRSEPISAHGLGELRFPLMTLLVALVYGAILAALPLELFKDRVNYLVYANESSIILNRYWQNGLFSVLSNEPLWLLTNIALRSVATGEWVVRMLIFLPASSVAYLVLRRDRKNFLWLLAFLLIAQVVKNHIIHLRQGYAIALFMAGWFAAGKKISWPLMLSSALVHTSFAFVVMLLATLKILQFLRWDPYLKIITCAVLGVVTGFLLPHIVSFLGARQALEYEFSGGAVSGLGFIFWSFIMALFLSSGRRFIAYNIFVISTIAFYLSTYFTTEVTARIFESTILLVLTAGLDLVGWRRNVFLSATVFYAVFQYMCRFDLPYMGWGV
jgi:hypothetical protein